MSELFIMRHGKAEDVSSHTGYADRPRRLTPEGIANIQAMIPALRQLDMIPDQIVSSPFPRAVETARIIHQGLKVIHSVQYMDALGADQSIFAFFENNLASLLESQQRLMIVGHEPCLSGLASLLISGRIDTRIQLKKAGMIHLECLTRDGKCRGILKGHWTSKLLRSCRFSGSK